MTSTDEHAHGARTPYSVDGVENLMPRAEAKQMPVARQEGRAVSCGRSPDPGVRAMGEGSARASHLARARRAPPTCRLSDEQGAALCARWMAGDLTAGERLFRDYAAMLDRFFRQRTATGAEDLVQQTLLACLEGWPRYEQRASFRAFVLGVARFQLYTHYRSTKRQRERVDDGDLSSSLSPLTSIEPCESERTELVLQSVRGLPSGLQLLLWKLYWEGMSVAQVANHLDVPVDTVYSRVRRARALLARAVRVHASVERHALATRRARAPGNRHGVSAGRSAA